MEQVGRLFHQSPIFVRLFAHTMAFVASGLPYAHIYTCYTFRYMSPSTV